MIKFCQKLKPTLLLYNWNQPFKYQIKAMLTFQRHAGNTAEPDYITDPKQIEGIPYSSSESLSFIFYIC